MGMGNKKMYVEFSFETHRRMSLLADLRVNGEKY
jgi:hypothetical protein